MKQIIIAILVVTTLIITLTLTSFFAKGQGINGVYSGVPWYDDKGNAVSAHGACIVKDHNRYYLFGERHTDTSKAFAGFTCYSSADLYNWKYESMALPVQDTGKLGPNRIGERVKVMMCPSSGEYVMYMHADDLSYKDQFVGYATSKNITGPYMFKGPLLYNGKPLKIWDMGTFQDKDGAGYILAHNGEIYKLGNDYRRIEGEVVKDMAPGCESPAVFRKGNIYYFLASHRTSWERNDNFYYTATSLSGPWASGGNFAPIGTLTFNSQTTFVLPIEGVKDTTYMFMGDRWSFPRQASAATYVWQPLTVSGSSITLPIYREVWQVHPSTGVVSYPSSHWRVIENTDKKQILYSGSWKEIGDGTASLSQSDDKGASFTIPFTGTQAGIYGNASTVNGYATVKIVNKKGKTVHESVIDMYCNYSETSLKYLSPVMKKDSYSLVVTVIGEHSSWSDKRRADYGSKGNFISLDKIIVAE